MSGDPEQDYFCDGLTETIITRLSSCPRLLVIARNSSFAYKGKPMKISQIANELGVQYVIEGSVQRTEDRARISVQLVEAKTGHHLWAEKYDRYIEDIFDFQDELTIEIMTALEVKLTEGDQAHARLKRWQKRSCSFDAIMKTLKALELTRRSNKEATFLARQEMESAISLCQDSGFYSLLAYTYLQELFLGSTNPLIAVAQASKAIKKSISLDENNSDAYITLGTLYLFRRQYVEAIAAAKKAIVLNPNGADAYAQLGFILYNSGQYQESVEFISKAIRLNPFPPSYYFLFLGHSERAVKRYDKAINAYTKAAHLEPDNLFSHLHLTITYELMGRQKDARDAAAQVIRIDPAFSLRSYGKATPLKDRKLLKQFLDAAQKAGLS